MGYFSQKALSLSERKYRKHEPILSRRELLVNRIDELNDRLDDFNRAPRNLFATYEIYPDRSLQHPILRYILPKDLHSYEEVNSAIMLAESDLWKMDQKRISSVMLLIPGQMLVQSVFGRRLV